MFDAYYHQATNDMSGAFRVRPPFVGDIVRDVLHRAYDDDRDLPDDFLRLLNRLNRLD